MPRRRPACWDRGGCAPGPPRRTGATPDPIEPIRRGPWAGRTEEGGRPVVRRRRRARAPAGAPRPARAGRRAASAELAKVLGALRDRANLARVGAPLHLPAHRGLRRGRPVPRRGRRGQELLAEHGRDRAVASSSEHLTVRFDDDVAAHLFSVAAGPRVGGARARARCSARSAGPGSGPSDERVSGPGAGRAVPPRRRDRQAGPVGDGHRPGHHLVLPRRGGAGRPARRPAGLAGHDGGRGRRRRDGVGLVGALVSLPERHGARPRWWWPTARPARRRGLAWPRSAGGRACARCRSTELARARWPRPTWCSARSRPTARRSAPDQLAPSGARTDRPLLVVDLGVPRNVDPAVGRSPGVTCSTWTTCARRSPRPWTGAASEVRSGPGDRGRGGGPLPGRQPGPGGGAGDRRAADRGSRRSARPSSSAGAAQFGELVRRASGRRWTRSPGPCWPSCCTSRRCCLKETAGDAAGRAPGRGAPHPLRPLAPWRPGRRAGRPGAAPGHPGLAAGPAARPTWSPTRSARAHRGLERRDRWWWPRPATVVADVPLDRIGGQGIFVKEVQAAVLDGRADAGRPLGQGPAAPRPGRRAGARRGPARGPTPATPWSGGRLDDLPPGAHGGHRVGPPPGPAGQPAARPHLRRPAGQHGAPRLAGPTTATWRPWWWPWPRSTGSGWSRPADRGARRRA